MRKSLVSAIALALAVSAGSVLALPAQAADDAKRRGATIAKLRDAASLAAENP